MRTTMTIDDDLYARLEEEARRQRRSIRDLVDAALRAALEPAGRHPYAITVHHSAIQPGVDARRLNQLADELEDESLVGRLSR